MSRSKMMSKFSHINCIDDLFLYLKLLVLFITKKICEGSEKCDAIKGTEMLVGFKLYLIVVIKNYLPAPFTSI